LCDEGGFAGEGKAGSERTIELVGIGETANDIRSQHAHSITVRNADNFVFQVFASDLAETRGNNDKSFYAFLAAFDRDLFHHAGGNTHYGRIDLAGNILDLMIAFQPEDFRFFLVDRVNLPSIPVLDQVFDHAITDLAWCS